MAEELKRYCKDCPTREDCRHAFGKYWMGKSRNGTGCNCPFPGYRRVTVEPHFTTQSKPNRKGRR